ncbi:hypothetical protein [Celeribacter baekdonensis]|uniref:Uncharacterized protein n=1 Tax=Celeribacter baekdonensis TaxID=875171 RepID=A0A2R4M4S5_9RHOB|nr:hypothetical protein [Celeribacter baekdonensis]AVW92163.1 hypothetical protein DA792_14620 [Celeribacter baekdonensis]
MALSNNNSLSASDYANIGSNTIIGSVSGTIEELGPKGGIAGAKAIGKWGGAATGAIVGTVDVIAAANNHDFKS